MQGNTVNLMWFRKIPPITQMETTFQVSLIPLDVRGFIRQQLYLLSRLKKVQKQKSAVHVK